jgi:hypothetical protein
LHNLYLILLFLYHTHSGTSCGINRNHHGYVHKFCILNNDKTALNTSLDNVYCWDKIKIAYKYIYIVENAKFVNVPKMVSVNVAASTTVCVRRHIDC